MVSASSRPIPSGMTARSLDVLTGRTEAEAAFKAQLFFLAQRWTLMRELTRQSPSPAPVISDFLLEKDKLFALWEAARDAGLATPNIGMLTDIICCPGGDFCSLANAKSIPVAEAIQRRFDDLDYLHDLGDIDLNISGCMNACGHHHVGHIGILGVEKKGQEFYQLTLGGSSAEDAALGDRLGRAISADEVPTAIEALVARYKSLRSGNERFLDTYRRVGIEPFQDAVYGEAVTPRREVA